MKEYLTHLTCEHCSKFPTMFVPPEVPENPNMILIGEAPGEVELQKGRPFVGESGSLLRMLISQTGARPIILNSVNTYDENKPTIKQIKMCREAHLLPILDEYPNIPIVSLGGYAAEAVLGGKRGEESTAGKVLWKFGRNVLFTYHPAYYLWAHRDDRILEHIRLHMESALRPEYRPQFEEGEIPDGLQNIVVDIEADTTEYPQYGSILRVLGVMDLATGKKYLTRKITADTRRHLEAAKLVVGHNLIYDLVHLGYHGIRFERARLFDTLIYQKHIAPKELDYGLKYLGKREQMPPYEAEFRTQMDMGIIVRDVPEEILLPYNANDLEGTGRLARRGIGREPKSFLLDMDYVRLVRDMTLNGIRVNAHALQRLNRNITVNIEMLERKARRIGHLGKDFNFNSHPQKKAAIEEALGHSVSDTRKETLEEMIHESSLIPVLLDLSKLSKRKSTFIEATLAKITKEKMVHSQYTPNGTETSRLSSRNPNLQNQDPKVREVFVSRYGR